MLIKTKFCKQVNLSLQPITLSYGIILQTLLQFWRQFLTLLDCRAPFLTFFPRTTVIIIRRLFLTLESKLITVSIGVYPLIVNGDFWVTLEDSAKISVHTILREVVQVTTLGGDALCHIHIIGNEILATQGTIYGIDELLNRQLLRVVITNFVVKHIDFSLERFYRTRPRVCQFAVFHYNFCHIFKSNRMLFKNNFL